MCVLFCYRKELMAMNFTNASINASIANNTSTNASAVRGGARSVAKVATTKGTPMPFTPADYSWMGWLAIPVILCCCCACFSDVNSVNKGMKYRPTKFRSRYTPRENKYGLIATDSHGVAVALIPVDVFDPCEQCC